MIYVAVGFRLDRKQSVGYRVCRTTDELLNAVKWLVENRKAQIISIRAVECEERDSFFESHR